jgi:hypothetical protein
LENLKAQGLKCSETALDDLLRVRREDAGESEAMDASDAAEEEPMPMIAAMVNLLGANRGYRNTPEEAEGQPLCMRGSLSSRAEDGIQAEDGIYSFYYVWDVSDRGRGRELRGRRGVRGLV